ncbi:hypothetical protein [Streptomyces sp. NPDC053367]|uniref:hypothetical protein n=1 Tax=Streptomyces sp. NPDC053367 TaxID=3365700 RepID=UPI0037D83C4A
MSRTTTEAVRAAAFGFAAVALFLCLVYDRADGARWDVLAALAAGAVCAGVWAFATRGEPVPAPGPRQWHGLPSVLPRNPVDRFAVAGMLLAATAPFAAYRFAAHGEVHDGFLVLGALPLVVWLLVFVPVLWRLLVRRLPERHRLLAQDAEAGRVVAVRFESAGAEWARIVEEDNPRLIDPRPEIARMLKVRDEHGKWYGVQGLLPGLFGRSTVGEVSLFGARFKGEHIWIMWPERWEAVLAVARRQRPPAYPVAVVSETGEMIWGYAAIDYTDRYLTDPANLRPTVPGLAGRPLRPRPAFRTAVHGRMYLRLAVALAALTPLLLDLVSGAASAWLGFLAAVALADAPFAASRANARVPDPTRWTVPPVADLRTGGGAAR